MSPRAAPRWADNREALARALDVVLPDDPREWTVRARDMELAPMTVGALARASPAPIELWVVRQWLKALYVCLNQLVVRWGDELLLAVPPALDDSLPAYRCPPLDGSCPLPPLEAEQPRGARLAALQAGGLFEPVALGPRLHTLLRRRQAGPAPETDERHQILSLLYALRHWSGAGTGDLVHPSAFCEPAQFPDAIIEDLARPQRGGGPVRFEISRDHSDVTIKCFPDRLAASAESTEGWIRGYLLVERPHDSQIDGSTRRLWHCTLEVSPTEWSLRRELLWTRFEDGMEMS